ncbi:NAD(P)-binding protein [Hortaea werneckii]|nr:NAD(P)-binding protein [Hortaea werneckii]
MEASPREADEKSNFTVLVTGANSGLGFSICCRLIDEFLYTRPQSQTLQLFFSTRDTAKSNDTLCRLNAHLEKTIQEANARTEGVRLLLQGRVRLEGVLVDLTRLSTVQGLAKQLLKRGEVLDAVIWNAGIPGWKGLNWPRAIWEVCTDLVHACIYPSYPVPDVGLLAKPQLQGSSAGQNGRAVAATASSQQGEEPRLGQVFLANVFGHYMLTHWLAPLLTPASRIIWISSISAVPSTFSLEDLQGLASHTAYEGSKRLTDLMVLTSELPSTAPYVSSFMASKERGQAKPKMLVTHPGVVGTSISGLNWFMTVCMMGAFYLARLLGSPWHPIDPYKGAISAAFAALSPLSQLVDFEQSEGKGKWGSSTDVHGNERVGRTEVEGWGYCGEVGKVPRGSVISKSVMTGKYRGHRETTREMREQFEEDGRTVWKEIEDLRIEWEQRLGNVDVQES